MSEASYQLNVDRGVTGPWTSTCLMASYDRISGVTGIATQTYARYEQLRHLFVETVGDDANFIPQEISRQFNELKVEYQAQLGVLTPRNIVETRVDTKDELQGTLARLAVGGYRTAIYLDTGGLHAVGVTQLDGEYYDVRSTWSPFPDGESVSVSDIFDYLDRAPRQRKRATNSRRTDPADNIIALPPEPAGCKPPYPCL